jgi:3-hydroxybutyryl-CoA dehydrogenase
MVEENVASVADIDRGMTLGYKLPVGLLELTDRVGSTFGLRSPNS